MAAASDRHFLMGGLPTDPGRRQLLGVNVVVAPQMPARTAIVGDWKRAILRRPGGVGLTWTEMNSDDWEHNLVRWRAEVRAVLAVKMPSAFVVADLAA